MAPSALNELKDKLDQARQRNKNGGFPSTPRPTINLKERRVLRGHFGKGACISVCRRGWPTTRG